MKAQVRRPEPSVVRNQNHWADAVDVPGLQAARNGRTQLTGAAGRMILLGALRPAYMWLYRIRSAKVLRRFRELHDPEGFATLGAICDGIERFTALDRSFAFQRYLPEFEFRGKKQHRRSHYALGAAAMIRAGVRPALLDEVMWWDTNDLFVWSLYALVIYIRLAAERTGDAVAVVCERLAARHGIELAAN